MQAKNVINGTWGQVWLDGDLIAEAIAVQAKVTLNKADVNFCGDLWKKTKVIGIEGKGTLKMNKVSSRMLLKVQDNIRKGKETICTMVVKLADPDSDGSERITLKGVCFDELTLMDFEVKKNIEEQMPFTFSGWDTIDTIQPPVV